MELHLLEVVDLEDTVEAVDTAVAEEMEDTVGVVDPAVDTAVVVDLVGTAQVAEARATPATEDTRTKLWKK